MRTIIKRVSKAEAALSVLEAARNGEKHRVRLNGVREQVEDGYVPSTVLQEVAGWRYSARLHDLREQGYEIDGKRLHGSLWIFRLVP